MKILRLLLLLIASIVASVFTSCAAAPSGGEKPKFSANLIDGVCVADSSGKYQICVNPLFNTATMRQTDGAGRIQTLVRGPDGTFRGTGADGSTIVYTPGSDVVVTGPPSGPPSGKTVTPTIS